MERAIISVNKTKKGKDEVKLTFENGKSMPVQGLTHADLQSLNGKKVEVQRESGQIIKIVFEGKEIYSKSLTQKYSKGSSSFSHFSRQSSHHNIQTRNEQIDACAPYNFVPLNEKVVQAEQILYFDKYHEDRYTGYIDLTIETKTPLYIRGTLTNFFSPAGIPRIPGSSLRGMIRTMVEIMSFGKFGFFDDKRLYFRGLADLSGLRKEYQRIMSSFDSNSKKAIYKMSAGYIYRDGLKFYILPANGYKQIKKTEAREIIETNGYKYEQFKHYDIGTGNIVVSGDMQNKKRDWFIDYPNSSAKAFEIPVKDIQDYKNDSNRNKDAPNLLNLAAKAKTPCFYTKYIDHRGRDRVAFGHTAMFRMPYQKTIGDHIPSNLKDQTVTDIAEAIFGKESQFATRVFFEDAYLENPRADKFEEEKVPKTLLGPKPTTFQHYLVQNPENLQDHPKNLAHYNSPNPIRGNKLYWHREPDWTKEDQSDFNPKIDTKINPVKPNNKFTGRIRFENLSKVELGALLFALDLPDGCCHKHGMGKPLGLGSVKITPTLYLSNRKDRYTDLLSEWESPLQPSTNKGETIDDFKKDFQDYILKELGQTVTDLWEVDRMKELKRMLDYNNKPSDDKTRYMQIQGPNNNEFKHRNVLPKPTEVK